MSKNSAASSAIVPTNRGIYLAVQNSAERSRMEDTLVLDGFDVSVFPSAAALWESFRERPTRFVISDRRFSDSYSGLDLCRSIRKDFLLPYVYVVILSNMKRLNEIKEGLAAGVDDYVIKPPNPLQLRSRALVGRRWLAYIDSLYAPKIDVGNREPTPKSKKTQQQVRTQV